jgi:hypothetical protein
LKIRVVSLYLLFGVTVLPLFPQSANGGSDSIFVINAFYFNIEGRTRPESVIRVGEFKKGEELKGRENLDKYIKDKTQLLLNQRVLKKVEIEYTIGERLKNGKYPVDLMLSLEDTWNIIAVPYPKYDTNSGFELIVKARDYNFMGSMNPLRLDFGYQYDENGRNSLVFELDSDTPFRAFGYNWNFNFDHVFNYRPDTSEPYYYKNVTGLSMELPFKTTTFTFGVEESFFLNEENSDRYKPDYGDFQSGLYLSSLLYTSWKIPSGLEISSYGEVTYTPKISVTFNNRLSGMSLDAFRLGPFIGFDHSLGFNRIDWIGNYRRGLDVSIRNAFKYDFHRVDRNISPLDIDYSVVGTGHFILHDNFGISSNLQFRHWIYQDPNYNGSAADALRGILDKAVHANYMLSLNLDFPFRVLQFLPSQWFHTSKLRFFDFDMHVSPIFDMAIYEAPSSGNPLPSTSIITLGSNNMLFTGGLEVIVFPAFMRSLYIRASLAWNFVEQINNPGAYYLNPVFPIIPHLPGGDNREIFVGIGHHY